MGTAVRPAKTPPGPWDAFADVDVFVDEVLAEPRSHGQAWCAADAIGAKATARRSGASQGRHGDRVRLFVWYAMAGEAGQGSAGAAGGIARRGDRAAVRHPLRHAIRTVRSLDPARPL